jgi:hypothetical protein
MALLVSWCCTAGFAYSNLTAKDTALDTRITTASDTLTVRINNLEGAINRIEKRADGVDTKLDYFRTERTLVDVQRTAEISKLQTGVDDLKQLMRDHIRGESSSAPTH